jgi:hypothetical protein
VAAPEPKTTVEKGAYGQPPYDCRLPGVGAEGAPKGASSSTGTVFSRSFTVFGGSGGGTQGQKGTLEILKCYKLYIK